MERYVNRRRVDRVPGERRRKVAHALRLAAPTVLVLTLLGGGGTVLYRTLFAGEILRVKAIRFHGLSRLDSSDLLKAIPVRPGDHLLLADPEAIEAALSKVGWIERAEVRRRLGEGAIEIDVRERRAAALVSLGDLYLVDERGLVFEHAHPGLGLDLPVVTGVELETYLSRRAEMTEVLAGAVALIGRWADSRLDARLPLAEIHVDPVFGTTVVANDGTEIRLGLNDLDAKLSRLARLLPALAVETRKAEVIRLDDRVHPERVTVRFAEETMAGGPVAAARPETAGKQ